MRKRKISLVLILAFFLIVLLFVYGGSYLVAQKIEAEVDRLFPEIATESRVEGLNFSYKEGLRIENFYMEILSDEQKSSATGKDIHASINWMGFLLSGGKLRINSLYMSSFSVRIAKPFETLLDEEVEDIINTSVHNILKRETISANFSLRIDEFHIVDSSDRVFRVRPIQLTRKGTKELSLFVSEAAVDSVTSFRYLRMEIEDYVVSDSLTDLISTVKKSFTKESLTPEFLRETILQESDLKRSLKSQFQFGKFHLGLGIANINNDLIDSLFGFDLHMEKGEEVFRFNAKVQDLYSPLDTLEDFVLHTSLGDTELLIDSFSVHSQKGGRYEISGAIRSPGESSSLTLNIHGLKSSLVKALWVDFPNNLKGKLSLRGTLDGDLFNYRSWHYRGDAFVEGFHLGPIPQLKSLSNQVPLPVTMDSLILDSIDISSAGCDLNLSASVVDTAILVPFRPYPMISRLRYRQKEGALYFDTLSSFPIRFKGAEHILSARDLTLYVDSLWSPKPKVLSLSARSLDLATEKEMVSLKSKKSRGFFTSLSALPQIDIKKIEIRDKKRRVHPDTLGYYYPTLLTGRGISTEIKGSEGKEQLILAVDSLVIPKQGRVSTARAQIDLHNDSVPLYTYSLQEGFLHEKALPQKLKKAKINPSQIVSLLPKSKCYIGNLRVQNDSSTLLSVKKMRVNYVNDTLYNFSFTTLFKKGTLHLKDGNGRFIKKGNSVALQKGVLKKVTIHSTMDSKKLIKGYSRGTLNGALLPLLPKKSLTISHFTLKKQDTVTLKAREVTVVRKDSIRIAINLLSASLYNRISCKWGAFVLSLGKKGNKLQRMDVSQLKIEHSPAISLKKKGKSFDNKMIHRFKKGLHLLDTYVDTGASISIQSCTGSADGLGSFSFKKLLVKTGKKRNSFSKFSIRKLHYPGFDPVNSFTTKLKRQKNRWLLDSMKLVSGDNTRLFASGYLRPTKLVPCSLHVRVENFKLSTIQKHYFKKTNAKIRGGAYGQIKFTGNLFDRNSWQAKRASITLLNTTVENLPLQKGEKIQKYAPTFRKLKFSKIIINPVDLRKRGRIHIKYLDAKSDKVDFTGWGSLDFRGRFYFEMKGKVHREDADALPRLTRLALNEASKSEYGKFYAKLYGDTNKQYLVPERGIAGKIIRSQFRKIGASFRNLFNQKD